MPRAKSDNQTGNRDARLEIRMSPEELETLRAASAPEYLGTWARRVLVREAAKCAKRLGSKKST